MGSWFAKPSTGPCLELSDYSPQFHPGHFHSVPLGCPTNVSFLKFLLKFTSFDLIILIQELSPKRVSGVALEEKHTNHALKITHIGWIIFLSLEPKLVGFN